MKGEWHGYWEGKDGEWLSEEGRKMRKIRRMVCEKVRLVEYLGYSWRNLEEVKEWHWKILG